MKKMCKCLSPLICMLLIVLCVGCGDVKVKGTWTTEIDLSAEAYNAASEWFKGTWMCEDVDIKSYMTLPGVAINVTFFSNNSWTNEIDIESYEACKEAAYTGLRDALCELITIRFAAAGKGDISANSVDDMMIDTLGMSLDDYISKYGPILIPTVDELQLKYNKSGIYDSKAEVANEQNK